MSRNVVRLVCIGGNGPSDTRVLFCTAVCNSITLSDVQTRGDFRGKRRLGRHLRADALCRRGLRIPFENPYAVLVTNTWGIRLTTPFAWFAI